MVVVVALVVGFLGVELVVVVRERVVDLVSVVVVECLRVVVLVGEGFVGEVLVVVECFFDVVVGFGQSGH